MPWLETNPRPHVLENLLEFLARHVARLALPVERLAVSDHEVEIILELTGRAVLAVLQLLPHGTQVHRLQDGLVVCRQVECDRINRLQKPVVERPDFRVGQLVQDDFATAQLWRQVQKFWSLHLALDLTEVLVGPEGCEVANSGELLKCLFTKTMGRQPCSFP